MKILLTGATGFIGGHLVSNLLLNNCYSLVAATRSRTNHVLYIRTENVGDITSDTDWSTALDGVDAVIHLAARVHIMDDQSSDPLEAFRFTNTAGTLNLAKQSSAAGVKRFIYLSSIKVNGENTIDGKTFKSTDSYIPTDPYGLSKYEAEQGLREIAEHSELEVIIIRPPLVYGAGVKANFRKMMQWLQSGVPLPLGAINNKRSLVAVENLVDLIVTCIEHPSAGNRTFLVSDDEDVSTTELLQLMAKALGKPARLLLVPQLLLTSGLSLVGKSAIAQRLCDSLQVDVSQTKQILNWKPPVSMDVALAKTARAFLDNEKTV